jgi:phenylacetate-CoA ligase
MRSEWLDASLRTAWERLPFYRRLWGDAAPAAMPVHLEEWPTWAVGDLRDELQRNPPFGELYVAEALEDVAFIHSSTGTTGNPRLFPLCTTDMPRLNLQYRRFYTLMGLRPTDVVVMTGSYGVPAGAWSLTRAIRAVGATVIPVSSGKVTPPNKVVDLIDATSATAICGTASYVLHIGRTAAEGGRELRDSSVRLVLLSGETATGEQRSEIEQRWGARTRSYYANTDLGWVAAECEHSGDQRGELGMHVFDDMSYVEILDEHRQPCGDGEAGEVVITTSVRRSTPRIRFRTGDRSAIDRGPCPCGARSPRLLPITGRVDDAIRYHGVTIWPTAVESVIHDTLGALSEFYIELRPTASGREDLVVVVECDQSGEAHANLAAAFRKAFQVRVEVEPVPPGALAATTRLGVSDKVRRVVR